MFSEDRIFQIKNGINITENMQALYSENLGLLHVIGNELHLSKEDREDFMQLAYLALHDAIKAFSVDSEYSFLSYYRRCLRHTYFLYRLEMKYPTKLNQYSIKHAQSLNENNGVESVSFDSISFPSTEGGFKKCEDRLICDVIWREINVSLTPINADILYRYYKRNQTYREIGNNYGICINSIRSRIIRSLRILKRSKILQEIAKEYYGIDV